MPRGFRRQEIGDDWLLIGDLLARKIDPSTSPEDRAEAAAAIREAGDRMGRWIAPAPTPEVAAPLFGRPDPQPRYETLDPDQRSYEDGGPRRGSEVVETAWPAFEAEAAHAS